MHERICGDEIRASFAEALKAQQSGPIGPQRERYAPRQWFPRMSEDLWEVKTPAAVVSLGQLSEEESRKSRKWTAGDNEVPGWLVVMLLRSREGYRVLSWIMRGDDPPDWWADFQMVVREMTARLERLSEHK
jgi:hypothetical protein